MVRRTDIQRRNDWIYREFDRLRRGRHPQYRGEKVKVDKAIEIIRRELKRKKQFQCNRDLRRRTVYNIIYEP